MSKKELSIKILGFLGTALGLIAMLVAACVIDASVFIIEFVVKFLRERKLRKETETTTGDAVGFKLPTFLFGSSSFFKHSPFTFNHPLAFAYANFPKLKDWVVDKSKLYQLDTE